MNSLLTVRTSVPYFYMLPITVKLIVPMVNVMGIRFQIFIANLHVIENFTRK